MTMRPLALMPSLLQGFTSIDALSFAFVVVRIMGLESRNYGRTTER
jgi:hypothetical protein